MAVCDNIITYACGELQLHIGKCYVRAQNKSSGPNGYCSVLNGYRLVNDIRDVCAAGIVEQNSLPSQICHTVGCVIYIVTQICPTGRQSPWGERSGEEAGCQ